MKITGHKILVTGACGRLGAALFPVLKQQYGEQQVVLSDVAPDTGKLPCLKVNVLDKNELHNLVIREKIDVIYHLAASLTVAGEKQPRQAWELNVQGLIHVLDVAKCENIRVFWPSSVAVFGATSPRAGCPQFTVTEPSTLYGMSKVAGELWCKYYREHFGVDVRSLRYPGLVSHTNTSRGGTTDFAADMFRQGLASRQYSCYLKPHTTVPLLYMPDAVNAAMQLMDAPLPALRTGAAYNLAGLSCSPQELEGAIRDHLPAFRVVYKPDGRQQVAESWPASVDDLHARQDWGWKPAYDLHEMTQDMLRQLEKVHT